MVLEVGRIDQAIPDDRAIRLWPGLDFQPDPSDNFGLPYGQPDWILDAHNTKSGRVFILGTGPSLASQMDVLAGLRSEDTWTVNRMARWTDLPFIPTHHSVTEPGPIIDWGRGVHHEYDFPRAMNRIAVHWFPVTAPGWLWVAKAHDDVQLRWEGFFGLGDQFPPIPSGWASPITLLQVAAWLGYQEFYLLGCDTTQVGQAWDTEKGNTKQPRAILTILECADRARAEIEKAGRKLIDCTPGGRMNQEGILPYVDLAEVLA